MNKDEVAYSSEKKYRKGDQSMSELMGNVILLQMVTNNAWHNMIGIRSITSKSLWSNRPQRSTDYEVVQEPVTATIECPSGNREQNENAKQINF